MSKRNLVAVLLVLVALWYWFGPFGAEEDAALLTGRVWISRLPQDPRDKVSALVLLERDKVGVFRHASAYQGDYDLFRFALRSAVLDLEMLQSGTEHRVGFRATRCQQPGFDYCLTLEGSPRGPVRYVSRRGWEVQERSQADALLLGLTQER